MILPGAEQQVKMKFHNEANRLEELFGISLANITLEFDKGAHLGAASVARGIVYISSNYLNTEKNIQVILGETILHEICHIVAYRKYKELGHCRTWKNVYLAAGGNGQRLCDSRKLDAQDNARKHTEIVGHCTCGKSFIVSAAKLTRMRNHTTNGRICSSCKCDLGKTFVVDKKMERFV